MSQKLISTELRQKILLIIRERILVDLPTKKIEQMTIAELGIDSINLLQLSFDLETDFNLKIELDTLSSGTTISMLIDQLVSMDD
jgi:acyl carrier protein